MRFSRTKSLRATALTGAVALAATAGVVGTATPASAGGKDGNCESGEFCLFYLQNRTDSVFDLYVGEADFSVDQFPTVAGRPVDNNTRSYDNKDTYYWRVYDGANYTGDELLCIAPGDRGNFRHSDWDRASSANFSSTAC
jgi:Peptidase inhibitor family I36